jgi:hypothetical protein
MNSRARWADGALDLTDDLEQAASYLTVGRVSDATGLSANTIRDSLTRREITTPENPRGALCRPAARIGDVPLWAQEQVDEFLRRKEAAEAIAATDLPLVSDEEASRRGLASTEEIATRFGQHDQTVRRWQRYDKDYPKAVARLSRDGRSGPPEHLRELAAVDAWHEAKLARGDDPDEAPADPAVPEQGAAPERESVPTP